MQKIEQGDIVRLHRGKVPFLVISSDFFNASGLSVVCPLVPSASLDALHVPLKTSSGDYFALCEELSTASLQQRGCTVTDHIKVSNLMEIIYRVQSIIDYFPHAE